jgi:Uma2 family endonuclease
VATQSIPRITEEEYLRRERAAERKSEFIAGEIFPMPGGSLRHSQLAVKWMAELAMRLRDKPFLVFSSDMRVRTWVTGAYVYPDVSVVAGPPEIYKGATDILTNPTMVIEILSPSTADYDHGKKFEVYREIPTFGDYLLVHTASPLVEHFARQPDSSWTFREHRGMESAVTSASIACTVPLAEVYKGVFDLPE